MISPRQPHCREMFLDAYLPLDTAAYKNNLLHRLIWELTWELWNTTPFESDFFGVVGAFWYSKSILTGKCTCRQGSSLVLVRVPGGNDRDSYKGLTEANLIQDYLWGVGVMGRGLRAISDGEVEREKGRNTFDFSLLPVLYSPDSASHWQNPTKSQRRAERGDLVHRSQPLGHRAR